MNTDASNAFDGRLIEIVNAEKQLWALIHSKGLLYPDVKDLYRNTRTSYEKIILNDYQIKELHDVEYSLWKLHYKHIGEFRRRIRKSSGMPHDAVDVEQFKLFLEEATEYYKDLITKIRDRWKLLEEPLVHENDDISSPTERSKVDNCMFSCHRFLVRLGDLARYKEFYGKPDIQSCNWSSAAAYYLEATRIWPDSGNPHNQTKKHFGACNVTFRCMQLALLATYVGDEFFALYHCVRSLAIKEPFPDAWDNLILLLEKNKGTHLRSLPSETHFNFFKPSGRSDEPTIFAQNELSSLFVRMISFFYINSSLEGFNCTFASALRQLEALMELDDRKLKDTLESYQYMESTRTGPFHAIHIVSILIFSIEDLMKRSELEESDDGSGIERPALTNLAWTATFIFMGRFVDRCLKDNCKDHCPLLSAVLVFSEWLVGVLDKVETCGVNEESMSAAMTYFFSSFADLLNEFEESESEDFSHGSVALWEDCELQGFEPLACAHEALDFLCHLECRNGFESGRACRINRIIGAASKIANISNDSQKWILYDKVERKFYLPESNIFPDKRESKLESRSDLVARGPQQSVNEATEECEKQVHGEDNPSSNGKSVAIEEEEVILFKPIARYNSAPICSSMLTTDDIHPELEVTGNNMSSSEECLRRASSLFVAQIESPRQKEPFVKDSVSYPFSEGPASAGHPSLNAWIHDRRNFSTEPHKNNSNGVEGASSISLASLSINVTGDAVHDSGPITAITHCSSPPYSTPIPSAPLLPDDAIWFGGDSYGFSQGKNSGGLSETDTYLGASPRVGGYSNWNAAHGTGFADPYPPFIGLANTFERFHQYKNDHDLEWGNNFKWPLHFNGPDASRFGLYDRWGNPLASNSMIYLENPTVYPGLPLVYGAEGQMREKAFHGLPKPSSYACGAEMDPRAEQQPLLQYLKEKEWQLQREPQLRGPPTFIGN